MEIDSVRAHCERLRAVGPFRDRLDQVHARWTQDARLGEPERRWLDDALAVLPDSNRLDAVLERAANLPELSSLRARQLESLQGAWVDALERLRAEIVEREGARAPVLEALFGPRKLPSRRRAKQDEALAQESELDRRLAGAYVTRMFEPPEFEWARTRIETVRSAALAWKSACEAPPLAEPEADALRAELSEAASALERAMRRARLLVEAALLLLPGAFEETELGSGGPRRKASS